MMIFKTKEAADSMRESLKGDSVFFEIDHRVVREY
jgi:hypothetical protein